MGPTAVAELKEGAVSHSTVRPGDFGLESCAAGELVGGGPEDNAEIILRVLEGGDRGGARTAVLMNAGAALYVADISETIEDGVAAAAAAIDDGRALDALQALREATNASTSG
jgi:anthranilate phosphoribosyltransferase